MNFGFSYIGVIFLAMLFVPNIFWTKNKPETVELMHDYMEKTVIRHPIKKIDI